MRSIGQGNRKEKTMSVLQVKIQYPVTPVQQYNAKRGLSSDRYCRDVRVQ